MELLRKCVECVSELVLEVSVLTIIRIQNIGKPAPTKKSAEESIPRLIAKVG